MRGDQNGDFLLDAAQQSPGVPQTTPQAGLFVTAVAADGGATVVILEEGDAVLFDALHNRHIVVKAASPPGFLNLPGDAPLKGAVADAQDAQAALAAEAAAAGPVADAPVDPAPANG